MRWLLCVRICSLLQGCRASSLPWEAKESIRLSLPSNWQRQWCPKRVHGGVMVGVLGSSATLWVSLGSGTFSVRLQTTHRTCSSSKQAAWARGWPVHGWMRCLSLVQILLWLSYSPFRAGYQCCGRWSFVKPAKEQQIVRLLFSGQWHFCYISYSKSNGRWWKRQSCLGPKALLGWFL